MSTGFPRFNRLSNSACAAAVVSARSAMLDQAEALAHAREMWAEGNAAPEAPAPEDATGQAWTVDVFNAVRETEHGTVIDPIGCLACGGKAWRDEHGVVHVDKCQIIPSCEQSWVDMHPEHYRKPDGTLVAHALPCGGSNCGAWLRLADERGGQLPHPEIDGECAVDVEGERFRREGRQLLNTMKPSFSLEEFEPFDGEPFGTESQVPDA